MKQLTLTIATGICFCLNALAGTISVGNSSFEDGSTGFGNPPGWVLVNSTSSPTFSSDVQVAVNGTVFPLATGVDGLQFAAIDLDHNSLSPANPDPIIPADGSIAELTSDAVGVFAPSTLYTLTARVGLLSAFDLLDVGLALGTGSPTLNDVFSPPSQPAFAFALINGSSLSDGVLQDLSITMNTSAFPNLVGQPMNISLIGHSQFVFGREAFFDNVQLTSGPAVPEPSSLILVGAGVLAMLLSLRKQVLRSVHLKNT